MHKRSRTLALALALLGGNASAIADEAPGRPPLSNRIRWATASELDNFGYDVYRGDQVEGPFKRITQLPLPGHGTTDLPHHYEFLDDRIEAGRAYYYYVESISLDGTRERFTPIQRAGPKGVQAEAAPPGGE